MESALRKTAPKNLEIIETLCFNPENGFLRLPGHIDRLEATCSKLQYPFDRGSILMALGEAVGSKSSRVRLTINIDGKIDIKIGKVENIERWNIGISDKVLNSDDPWLSVKTTNRIVYDTERANLTDLDELLFLNENNEVCEGTISNVFVLVGDLFLTPPLSCGCLPGILRQEMLSNGKAKEQILFLRDLIAADKVFIGNSLRGLIAADLVQK
jgi:4-amino-4-deoxychorismate lyase|tara:strand:+ start:48 stop:686 length:639 start_codon:yes stop_codon:yes gene_type:complete